MVIRPIQTTEVVRRTFPRATVHAVDADHKVWPCIATDDAVVVDNLLDSFLGTND